MRAYLFFAVSGFGYGLFLVSMIAFMGFLVNWPHWESIDEGVRGSYSLLTNTLLVLLFAIPHSVMARRFFKDWIAKKIPKPLERSVYVISSSLLMLFLMAAWSPIPDVVWQVNGDHARSLLYAGYALGWALLIGSTFQINHWEFVGLRQTLGELRGRAEAIAPSFVTPLLYRIVRHPMMTGMLLLLWCTPDMTVGHAQLAGLFSLYILAGTRLEERDLVRLFGDKYRRYQNRVPALVPLIGGRLPPRDIVGPGNCDERHQGRSR